LILSIDLGGTKILTAVTNSQGKMLSRDHSITPAPKGHEAVIQSILESAHRALEQANVAVSELTAIGIGAPGLSNPETGILFTSPNLPGWRDVPLRDIMQERLGKKTFLINDANAAALGEFILALPGVFVTSSILLSAPASAEALSLMARFTVELLVPLARWGI